jgi:hypothetical protein
MKKIQTPIRSSMGNQEIRIDSSGLTSSTGAGLDAHAELLKDRDDVRLLRHVSLERPTVVELAGNLLSLDGHLAHLALFHVAQEVGKGELLVRPAHGGALKQIEQREEKQNDDDPQRCVPAEIHGSPFLFTRGRRNSNLRSGQLERFELNKR